MKRKNEKWKNVKKNWNFLEKKSIEKKIEKKSKKKSKKNRKKSKKKSGKNREKNESKTILALGSTKVILQRGLDSDLHSARPNFAAKHTISNALSLEDICVILTMNRDYKFMITKTSNLPLFTNFLKRLKTLTQVEAQSFFNFPFEQTTAVIFRS